MTGLEMSRYIDIEKYHAFELKHPFYREMIGQILRQLKLNLSKRKRVLEIGAGTGILTKFLCQLKNIQLSALELDKSCFDILSRIHDKKLSCLQGDGINFADKKKFDIIVSSFAHHHIPYEKRFLFARNISKNLANNGLYIVGDELIPPFNNSKDKKTALFKYHLYIMQKCILAGSPELAELELESLRSGLRGIGDFKRSENMFEEEMAGFKLKEKIKLGPEIPDCGGVFVYVFQKEAEI